MRNSRPGFRGSAWLRAGHGVGFRRRLDIHAHRGTILFSLRAVFWPKETTRPDRQPWKGYRNHAKGGLG